MVQVLLEPPSISLAVALQPIRAPLTLNSGADSVGTTFASAPVRRTPPPRTSLPVGQKAMIVFSESDCGPLVALLERLFRPLRRRRVSPASSSRPALQDQLRRNPAPARRLGMDSGLAAIPRRFRQPQSALPNAVRAALRCGSSPSLEAGNFFGHSGSRRAPGIQGAIPAAARDATPVAVANGRPGPAD